MNFRLLAKQRPPRSEEGHQALEQLHSKFGDQAELVQQALNLLLRIAPTFDELTWQTLLALVRAELLDRFLGGFAERQRTEEGMTTPKIIVEIGQELRLDDALLQQWAKLA